MNFVAGQGEQLQQRRVRAGAREQGGGGRDQMHVLRRNVGRQIDHATRQHGRAQKGEAARIGFALRKVHQFDARCLQQHLHHQRFGGRGKHDGVELAA